MQLTDQEIKTSRLTLSESVIGKTRIYLDTMYWIRLRDQALSNDLKEQELLNLTFKLVDEKNCIFPISQITFLEICKQTDLRTRSKTFEIINRLSGGFSTITIDELIYLQIRHFFESKRGNSVHDLTELIWTKINLVQFGHNLPVQFYNFLLEEPFSDLHNKFGNELKSFVWHQDINQLNAECLEHENVHKNKRDLFLAEIAGLLDIHRPNIEQVMFDIYEKEMGVQITEDEKKISNLTGIIHESYKQNKITNELPHFTITAELFSAVRRNKGQKFDRNHTLDFFHASCALPFFHYFFTENQLFALIGQKKLNERFNCKVESNKEKVLELLNSLV
jgi:hypothetical protein